MGIARTTPYEIGHLADYGYNGSYVSLTNSQVNKLNSYINSLTPIIREKMPALANHIEKRDIRIAITEQVTKENSKGEKSVVSGFSLGTSNLIGINMYKKLLIVGTGTRIPFANDYNDFMRTYVHELTHDMGAGEFIARVTELYWGQSNRDFYNLYVDASRDLREIDDEGTRYRDYMLNSMSLEFREKWMDNSWNIKAGLNSSQIDEFCKDAKSEYEKFIIPKTKKD